MPLSYSRWPPAPKATVLCPGIHVLGTFAPLPSIMLGFLTHIGHVGDFVTSHLAYSPLDLLTIAGSAFWHQRPTRTPAGQ